MDQLERNKGKRFGPDFEMKCNMAEAGPGPARPRPVSCLRLIIPLELCTQRAMFIQVLH